MTQVMPIKIDAFFFLTHRGTQQIFSEPSEMAAYVTAQIHSAGIQQLQVHKATLCITQIK